MALKVLAKPLSPRQIKTLAKKDEHGYISGVVRVALGAVIRCDAEAFLDLLSDKLVGSCLLMDIQYKIVGHDGNDLLLCVRGDPTALFD